MSEVTFERPGQNEGVISVYSCPGDGWPTRCLGAVWYDDVVETWHFRPRDGIELMGDELQEIVDELENRNEGIF